MRLYNTLIARIGFLCGLPLPIRSCRRSRDFDLVFSRRDIRLPYKIANLMIGGM